MKLKLLPSKRLPQLVDTADMEVGGIYKMVGARGSLEYVGKLAIMTEERTMVCLEDGAVLSAAITGDARWTLVEQPVLHYQE